MPRKNNRKKYQTINGWSKRLPFWQIFAMLLMLVIEALSFYLLTASIQLNLISLFILYSLNYSFFVFVIVYFFKLTISDPSDPHLKDPDFSEDNESLVNCYSCQSIVFTKSHHCNTCNRCVDRFDHHCVFLNNCIGGQNYADFGKFLVVLITHTSIGITIGIIIAIQSHGVDRWLAITYSILGFTIFAEVTVLAFFHFYLSFCIYKTTLEFLRGSEGTVSNNQPKNTSSPAKVHPNNNEQIILTPRIGTEPEPQEQTGTDLKPRRL